MNKKEKNIYDKIQLLLNSSNMPEKDKELILKEFNKNVHRLDTIIKVSDKQQFELIKLNDKLALHKSELLWEVEEKTKILQELNQNLEKKVKGEVLKNRHKDKILYHQAKMKSISDLLSNISHQWRQPLSVISTASSGMTMQKEHGILTDEDFTKTCNLITKNAQKLSNTIDNFKRLMEDDSTIVNFNLKSNTNSFLELINSSIENYKINVIVDLEEHIEIKGFSNKLIQSFINIFNNARDILIRNNDKDNRYIFISQQMSNNNIIIKIKDNAGGIDNEILPKIFEPYFTTKHQSQGIGLSLHMTYNLIVNSMNGSLEVSNQTYTYNKQEHTGAEFIITLPVK